MVFDPPVDGPWSGQSPDLAAALGPVATLVRGHCLEDALAEWLDGLFCAKGDTTGLPKAVAVS
jgi:hypothetical protein